MCIANIHLYVTIEHIILGPKRLPDATRQATQTRRKETRVSSEGKTSHNEAGRGATRCDEAGRGETTYDELSRVEAGCANNPDSPRAATLCFTLVSSRLTRSAALPLSLSLHELNSSCALRLRSYRVVSLHTCDPSPNPFPLGRHKEAAEKKRAHFAAY